jgi:hypothetical protein
MRKIYKTSLLMFVMLATGLLQLTAQDSTKVMFIGRSPLTDLDMYKSDADMVDSLKSWGYSVKYVANDDYKILPADTPAFYNGIDGVIMNETVDSKAMLNYGPKFHGYPLPVICLEGFAVANTSDRWGWVAPATELHQTATGTENDLVIVVQDASHPIMAGYSNGDEVKWSNATVVSEIKPVSIMESTAVAYDGKLAKVKSHMVDKQAFWNLVTIDEIGKNKVKVVFWGINDFGISGVAGNESLGSADFFKIIRQSAAWAYPQPVSAKGIAKNNLTFTAFPNPAFDQVTVRFNTKSSELVRVSLHSITGTEVMMIAEKNSVVGNNFVDFNVEGVTNGVYFIKVAAGNDVQYQKLLIK